MKSRKPEQVQTPQIFISYSRKDQEFIGSIKYDLQKNGFNIWIDVQDILPTAEWWNVIIEAINNSAVFLVLISENNLKSGVCKQELLHAINAGKKIIPLIIENTNFLLIPPDIQKLNWVKWDANTSKENNITNLLFALNIDLGWHTLKTSLLSQTGFWKQNNETKMFC